MEAHECIQITAIALMRQSLEAHFKLLEEIHEAVTGNGKTGLNTEVALLKQSDATIKKDQRRLWGFLVLIMAAAGLLKAFF